MSTKRTRKHLKATVFDCFEKASGHVTPKNDHKNYKFSNDATAAAQRHGVVQQLKTLDQYKTYLDRNCSFFRSFDFVNKSCSVPFYTSICKIYKILKMNSL